jgi:hypothetical protein
MGAATLLFFSVALYSLLLCWGRQWGIVCLLVLIEMSWVGVAGGFGLLSLYLLDVLWLYLTALVAILSGVELVLSLFAFTTWHRATGQSFAGNKVGRLG